MSDEIEGPLEEQPSHRQHLNPEQYRAVTTIDGPLLILAGAGSGKTRVLTRRIAEILHQGIPAQQILAVTFTNKAAAEMRERVLELIGDAAEKVWVSTFHSTCCRILRADIEHIGYTRRFAIYDDDDQVRILKDQMDVWGYDRTAVDVRSIRSQIDHYKNRMITVDQVVSERRIHLNSPLVKMWRGYNDAMHASDALDFNDLIGHTVKLFKEHPAILAKWRDRFQYVMVDEYQDTNRGQYDLLTHLVSGHGNIAVVGDDDQSIYGFRGADVSIILNFERDNPEAAVIRLEQNYRSTKNILSVANAVVQINNNRLDKKLWTQSPNGAKVQLSIAQDEQDEAKRVVRQITKVRRHGHNYEDIAIIYRTNAMSRPLETELTRAKIPFRIVGGKKLYDRREIRDILGYLRVIVNPADDAAVLRIINVPRRGIGAKTLSKIRADAATRGTPLLVVARAGVSGKAGDGVKAFSNLLDELTDAARDKPLRELVTTVIERSGYRAALQADKTDKDELTLDARGRLANIDALIADAATFKPPESVWTNMDALTAWLDSIKLAADTKNIPPGGEVTLMTVHSSKGLEFPVVFCIQLNEGKFPHSRSEEQSIDEERRLAYVAFTRAMQRLIISRTQKSRAMSNGRFNTTEAKPSRFLFGLPQAACDGEIPSGAPARSPQEERILDSPGKAKLNAFIRNRRASALPDNAVLMELESMDQLQVGVKLLLDGKGMCEIIKLKGSMIRVTLSTGRSTWLPLQGLQAQVVVND